MAPQQPLRARTEPTRPVSTTIPRSRQEAIDRISAQAEEAAVLHLKPGGATDYDTPAELPAPAPTYSPAPLAEPADEAVSTGEPDFFGQSLIPEPIAAPAPAREPAAPVVTQSPEPVEVAPTPSAPLDRIEAVESMTKELKKPLSELIQRRGAAEFNLLFEELVRAGVSDVHMVRSKLENTFSVKGRVDGKLQDVHVYRGVEGQTILTTLKTEAKMSTGTSLVPEDGSYRLPIDDYPYRARAVTIPLFDGGEKLVFRLPQIGALRHLDDLGFTPKNLLATKELLAIPGGLTLFAGPTAEGKSTTALSSVQYLRTEDGMSVVTLEDPVERVLPGVEQIEVREEVVGAGFGDMARYINRFDANIIFLGEIRDRKTANAAIELAKSGRRVLATFHASDNVSAMLRLIEMTDATPLSVLDAVNGVISQRLVPRLVPGTSRFSGRYPIHEVTRNTDDLTDALISSVSRNEIRRVAAKSSTSFKENVEELVASGITTLEETRKVVRNV